MWQQLQKRLKRWFHPAVPRIPSRWQMAMMIWNRKTPWSRLAAVQSGLNEFAVGPIQRDEAFLLFGLIRSLRADCIVEVGFAEGHSCRTILQALEANGRCYSIDNNPYSRDLHQRHFKKDPRAIFLFQDQRELDTGPIKGPIDLVLMDGSHRLDENIACFEALRPKLSPDACLLIHDTGLWDPAHMEPIHRKILSEIDHKVLAEGVAHQIQERQFVNWLGEQFPKAQLIHIHTHKTLRHGFSILRMGDRLLHV